MRLTHGVHLAYCTNIHRGESWAEVLAGLEKHTLAVRRRVEPDRPYAIGLRLGDRASRELAEPAALDAFQRWLQRHQCYVFAINGFPFGRFHGTRVKEQVYAPDWTQPERLEYTRRLFRILARLVPPGVGGSVSTVPVSFKGFRLDERQLRVARENLWRAVEFLEQLSRESGHDLHLGLEPEPLCTLETTAETVRFFEQMQADRPGD
ncbi:MAG: metabolite traffic protein EboE, partial [Verrucomicrobiota bacterium]